MPCAESPRNFLFTSFEGGGSVAPFLTAVTRLVKRGHVVRFMSDRCNGPEAEAAGARFIPWTRAPSRPDRTRDTDTVRDWDAAEPQDQLVRLMENIMTGPALAYAEDTIEELRREPADLVVGSEMLPGVAAACEHLGQKFALLLVNVSLFPIPGIPPLGPGLTPPKTEEERNLHEEITAATVEMWDRGLPPLNAARSALSLDQLKSLVDFPRRAERVLIATARAFDFAPPVLDPKFRYVGPLLGEPAWAEPLNPPWDSGDQRPLVAVCFSTSFQNHAGALQRVIDAVADRPVRGVVTLSDAIHPGEIVPASNVLVVHSAPHDALMREAAVVVTHGGHGSVLRALSHRKPLLVMPHGRDQNDNAVRISTRGAGMVLPADAAVDEIREALDALLRNRDFTDGATRLGDLVAAEIESSPILEELEELASPGVSASKGLRVA